MSKTNFDICHDFFYSGFNQRFMPQRFNVGYSYNKFYSYNTVIGAVIKNKKGEAVLLISSDNMSNTTAKHLSNLWSASPYGKIRVPFKYGWDCFGEFKAEHAADLFNKELDRLSKAKMSLVKNRDEFIYCFKQATMFSESVYTLKFLKKFKKTYIQVTEHVDEIKAKQRKIDALNLKKANTKLEKLLKTQKIEEINEYRFFNDTVLVSLIKRRRDKALRKGAEIELNNVEKMSYAEIKHYQSSNPYVLDKLQTIVRKKRLDDANEKWETIRNFSIDDLESYQTDNYILTGRINQEILERKSKLFETELKKSVSLVGYAKTLKNIENDRYKLEAFRKAFCYENDFAFAWLSDDGTFKTTKRISLDKNVGIVALRLWKHNKLPLGAHVGVYTVLKITDEFVKIGCHTIPTKNLDELCEILDIK